MNDQAIIPFRRQAKPPRSPDQRLLDRARARLDRLAAEDGASGPDDLISLADDLLRLQGRLAGEKEAIGLEIRHQIDRLRAAQAYRSARQK